MNELLIAISYGLLGGFTRLLVGLLKSYNSKEKPKLNRIWFYILIVLSAGAFSGIVLGVSKTLSFLGGYAGIDLLDGYFKAFKRKEVRIK